MAISSLASNYKNLFFVVLLGLSAPSHARDPLRVLNASALAVVSAPIAFASAYCYLRDVHRQKESAALNTQHDREEKKPSLIQATCGPLFLYSSFTGMYSTVRTIHHLRAYLKR